MKAYKYRIYPSKAQKVVIDVSVENCRRLYNWLLALKITAYKKDGTRLSEFDLNKKIKGVGGLHSQVCQNVSGRLEKSFRNFFARVKKGGKGKGFPRFKKYGAYSSLTLPQVVNPAKIGKKTYFPRIGWLNTKYHRPISGIPKTLTVKKVKSGKYFITVCCDGIVDGQIKTTGKEVGIDLGLNHFVATSDGEFFEHPKPMKLFTEKRKHLAKKFSMAKKRSCNQGKARLKLAKLDEKIANTRNDFGWKLCQKIMRKYGLIFAEELEVGNMQKNHHLARAINDVSWSDFMQKLSFKAESAGGKVVKVHPKNTSQMCSGCGEMVAKSLCERVHCCPNCKLEIDRDLNAARNILTIGKIGQELPELSLKETKPLLLTQVGQQASSMKQETNQFIDW